VLKAEELLDCRDSETTARGSGGGCACPFWDGGEDRGGDGGGFGAEEVGCCEEGVEGAWTGIEGAGVYEQVACLFEEVLAYAWEIYGGGYAEGGEYPDK
jgi:hypothetical protein